MPTTRLILLACCSLFVGACSTLDSSEAECTGKSACPPVLVFKIFPDRYIAQPEKLHLAGEVTRTIVWAFAKRKEYVFDVNNATPDGVELIKIANGSTVGINPCFATNNSDGSGPPVARGEFYRCQVRSAAPNFEVTYKIRFRGATDNVRHVVDPTLTHNSDPTFDDVTRRQGGPTTTAVGVVRAAISMTAGVAAVSPPDIPVPRPSGPDQSHVVWSLPTGYMFNTNPQTGPFDGIDFGEVTGPTCFAVADEASVEPVDVGPLFKCIVFANANVPNKYKISFRETNKTPLSVDGLLSRP